MSAPRLLTSKVFLKDAAQCQLFAHCGRSYNALCITIGAVPSRKKSGWLAERFLRSKAVLYKEDTSGLVCRNRPMSF
jgi:hypothetical protein